LDDPSCEPERNPHRLGECACKFCSSFYKGKGACPLEKKKKANLYSRCSIGDLADDEIEDFKEECGIKSDCYIGVGYELRLESKDQIPLATVKERREHDDLLKQFNDDYAAGAAYIYESGYSDERYYTLDACIRLADKIRKVRPLAPNAPPSLTETTRTAKSAKKSDVKTQSRKHLTQVEKDEAIRRYASGESKTEIAKRLKRNPSIFSRGKLSDEMERMKEEAEKARKELYGDHEKEDYNYNKR